MHYLYFVFPLAVALPVLFLCENNCTSRWVVATALGVCLACFLAQLLPEEWMDAIPRLSLGAGMRGNARDLRPILAVALASAACYPAVAHFLYPLRDHLMKAFDRRCGKRR